jgi:hypothetical protein
LQVSHNLYVNMSDMLLKKYITDMNAMLTMAGDDYRYECESKP